MKRSLAAYQKAVPIPGIPATRFDHIVDTVYFGQSNESYGIQLADACNFFLKQHLAGNQAAERFYAILKDQIVGGETANILNYRGGNP